MKMNIASSLLPVLAIFLIVISTSCKKWSGEGKTVVEGQVIDVTTNKPVPFAVIRIKAANKNAAYGGYNMLIKGDTADANGKFNFSFDAETDLTYILAGHIKNQYYTAEEAGVKNAAKNKDLTVKLQPYGWVRVKIINEPPLEWAEIHIQGFHDQSITTQTNSNSTYIRTIDGNKAMQINYWIKPNGATNLIPFTPTVYAPALDTTELIIKY